MQNKLVVTGVIAAVVFSVLAFVATGKTVVQTVTQPFGATSVNVVEGNCLANQGGHICISSVAMNQASTTCSFQSPTATSTLRAQATFTNTYGGGFAVGWGRGSDPYSTTTSLGYKAAAIASGDTGTFVATSTLALGANLEDPSSVVPPNTFVNFKVGSTSPTVTGTCTAEFVY